MSTAQTNSRLALLFSNKEFKVFDLQAIKVARRKSREFQQDDIVSISPSEG